MFPELRGKYKYVNVVGGKAADDQTALTLGNYICNDACNVSMWVCLDYMRRKRKMLKIVQYAMLIIAIVLLVSTVTGLIINKEMNLMTTLFMFVALIVYFGIELIKKKNNE